MTEKKKLMGVGGGGLEEGGGAIGPSPPPPNQVPPQILVVAGEASGDDHAARLVAAIREFCPDAEFLGVGGEEMRAQGVRILTPASELAVVGLMEVVGHLPAIWQALRSIGRVLKTARPDLVILVDFPDFNFWVARLAKYYRVPVLYYISPQVWAWRTYRVRTLARLTDRLVVIFPFEADFYRAQGVTVDYVGHPFRETLPPLTDRRTFLLGHNLDPEALTIALLPGSRAGEIERHLPTMLKAASLIHRSIPQTQFILPLASTAPEGLVQSMVSGEDGVGAGFKPAPTALRLQHHPRPGLPGPGRGARRGGGLGHGHGGGGAGGGAHGHRLPGVTPHLCVGPPARPGGACGHGQSVGRGAGVSRTPAGRFHPGASGARGLESHPGPGAHKGGAARPGHGDPPPRGTGGLGPGRPGGGGIDNFSQARIK